MAESQNGNWKMQESKGQENMVTSIIVLGLNGFIEVQATKVAIESQNGPFLMVLGTASIALYKEKHGKERTGQDTGTRILESIHQTLMILFLSQYYGLLVAYRIGMILLESRDIHLTCLASTILAFFETTIAHQLHSHTIFRRVYYCLSSIAGIFLLQQMRFDTIGDSNALFSLGIMILAFVAQINPQASAKSNNRLIKAISLVTSSYFLNKSFFSGIVYTIVVLKKGKQFNSSENLKSNKRSYN